MEYVNDFTCSFFLDKMTELLIKKNKKSQEITTSVIPWLIFIVIIIRQPIHIPLLLLLRF